MSNKSGDKSAAALSLVTRISEGLIPKNTLSATEGGSEVPEEPVGSEVEETPEEPKLEAKLDVLSQDVTSVKEMLQQLLNDKEGNNE